MSFLNRIFKRHNDEESDGLSIYKDEPANNRFASFLFGFFALFVTLVVAAGLFFGGRAIYRSLNGDSDEKVAAPAKNDNSGDSKKTSSASDSNKSKSTNSKKTKKTSSMPNTGDNLPNTGDNIELPKTGDPGM